MRRRIIIIGILGLAGVAVFLRYQMVTKAPRPVIIFVMVRDSSSRAPIEHAQVRLTGTGSTVTSLTTSDGSTILRSVLAPHWERSARVTIAADHYKYWEQSLNSLAPQLIGNVSGAGDNQKEIEANILLERVADATPPVNGPSSKLVCHFYGESSQGSAAWNKDEECVIPHFEALDLTFHQTDFVCCGGGATSNTTSANIPAGVEIRTSGGHYWAVLNPAVQGGRFRIHTYCGPEPALGPGCNVDVQVIAHYH